MKTITGGFMRSVISLGVLLMITHFHARGQPSVNKLEVSCRPIEFKKGDILVRPNSNWLPGTSFVADGAGFGHAVIVTKGNSGYDPEEVLSGTEIMESHARDVPPEFQVRRIQGFKEDPDIRHANISFGNQYKGLRYRLRADLTEAQIDKVIEYVINQDAGISSWRAMKKSGDASQPKRHWYCSLLIYQAFKDVLGIDLDTNNGFTVYPNDLIVNPLFDHETGRAVF